MEFIDQRRWLTVRLTVVLIAATLLAVALAYVQSNLNGSQQLPSSPTATIESVNNEECPTIARYGVGQPEDRGCRKHPIDPGEGDEEADADPKGPKKPAP